MDHRISKDMISSGMIPSGEKNQEDLSRTQYGTAPSPNALADVYKKMYETKEEVINEHHQKDKDGNTIPHDGEELKEYAQLIPLATKLFTGAAAKTVGSNVVKGGIKRTLTRTGIKLGGKPGGQMVKTAIEKPLQTAANVNYASNMMPKTSSSKDGTNKTMAISAGADLFDIVKGQLLDEGLSEEEIRDIMLTLTPDEILNELSVGKMGDYISAADKDIKKTADSIRKDGSVMGDDPRVKKMTDRAKSMAMAGTKIAKKMTPPVK